MTKSSHEEDIKVQEPKVKIDPLKGRRANSQ